jgi:peptidoglycan-associated lipoprotein
MDSLAEARQDSLEQARADSLAEARQDSIELARQREQERLREQQRQREKELMEAKQALAIIYFAFDQSSLTAEARSKLQANAEILLQWPALEVVVEGHADERGTTEYNLALAERRAATVKQYYVDYGIAPDRIRTISYGEERPAVQGSTEQAWSKNRRAVTLLKE